MNYRPQKARREDRPDGTILLSSVHDLAPYPARTADWLHRWADERPDTVFLGERSGDGWRVIRYAEALGMVRAIAAALLGRGLGPDTRILIVSGNGVDHGLLTLAAHYVGIPTVPVAEQYSLIPGAEVQLAQIAALIRPTLVFAEDAQRFGRAFALDALDGCDVITSRNATPGMTRFDDLLAGGSADIDAAAARVGPDDVIKILMTSGSTSAPKGVMTTQRMMCANQQMYIDALPFLSARPPRLLDWLPWNHVFGGSNNFNQMLANGGSLYIDDGKPTPALIGRTIENNRLMNGTIAYNVPIGFALLRDAMKTDDDLRRRYFEDLDMLFYAGASLPADVWQDLHAMGVEIRGQAPMMNTCWGLTETGPAAIFQAEPSDLPGVVGVPLAGVTAKLVPDGEGRFEVRVTGPSVMPGYFDDPDRTADSLRRRRFLHLGRCDDLGR
jgi:feruloyl-CoA synthase